MLRSALERFGLSLRNSVFGCEVDWVAKPHRKATVVAAPCLAIESDLTVFLDCLGGHERLLH